MADEEKNNPTFKPISLKENVPTWLKIVSSKPISTGTSKYGDWNMWVLEVKEQQVFERGSKTPMKELYSGEVICFPSTKLHEQFLEFTQEVKRNVEIEIKLVPKRNTKGSFYTIYETKLIKDGNIPSDSVDYAYSKYLEDFNILTKNKILNNNKETFVTYGIGDPYFLKKDLLENLWDSNNGKTES